MSHFFRHLSNSKGPRGEYRTQNDLRSANSAQPSGGDLAQDLRGLPAGERWSFMFRMAWIRLKVSHRTSLSCLASAARTVSRQDEILALVAEKYSLVLHELSHAALGRS
jgi:hypothetical protein